MASAKLYSNVNIVLYTEKKIEIIYIYIYIAYHSINKYFTFNDVACMSVTTTTRSPKIEKMIGLANLYSTNNAIVYIKKKKYFNNSLMKHSQKIKYKNMIIYH